jgi:Putative zinc-finger
MSNNQEIIEARLAAYVDNDLDAQERTEIERHLEEHPQHRVLLEELRKGREMLRGLPRESAPPELAEAFNGQLERSVLLDGVGDYEEPRMRVGRWPQMFAAAAIVFLTLGLAGVVYFALPNHKAFQVADNRSAPKAPPTDNSLATSGRPEGGPADDGNLDRSKVADRDEKMFGKSGPFGAVNAKNGGNSVSEPHDNLTVLAENVSQVPQVQELLTDNYRAQNAIASTSNEAVILAVRSNNPKETERELAGYLEPNRIALERVPDQMPATVNSSLALRNSFNYGANAEAPAPEQNSGALGNSPEAIQQQQALMKKDESGPLNNAQGKAGNVAQSNVRGAGGGGGAAKPATDDATDQKLPANAAEAKRTNEESLAARNRGGQTLDSAAAPAPDNATRAQQGQQPAATDSQIAQRQQQQLPSPPAQQPAAQAALNQNAEQGVAEANFNTIDNLYVVRGLSRRQAQELTDRLSRNGEVRKAELSRRGGDGRGGYALNNSNLADNSTNDVTNSSRAFQSRADKGMAGLDAAGQNDRMREAAAKTRQEPNPAPGAAQQLREQHQTTADNENLGKEARSDLRDPALKPAAAMGPATRPADEIVRKGDSLNLYYRERQGEAEESEAVRVGDDGTIAPRGLDVAKDKTVVAAGKTVSELEKSLQTFGVGPATAPAVRNAMARRDVRVERVIQPAAAAPPPPAPAAQAGGMAAPAPGKNAINAPPASTPAGERAFAAAVNPSTLAAGPATRPAGLELAASQPAIAGAADEPVDVVIVVQKDASPAGNAANPAAPAPAPSAAPAGNNASTPAPATQPAAPAPRPDRP